MLEWLEYMIIALSIGSETPSVLEITSLLSVRPNESVIDTK